MKIGLFATWLSEHSGGIENLCYNLFKGLKKNNDVKCFSLNVDENEKFENSVYYSKTNKRTVPVFFYLKSYLQERKKGNFDINIAIHWGPGLCALFIKKIFGTPYLVYVHGKEVDYFKTPLHRWLVGLVLNNAKYIVGNSKYTLGLCSWAKNKQTALIHPGVDDALFTAPKQPIQLPADEIQLFAISRLVRRKGFQYVLQAVKLLKDEGHAAHFTLAGVGEMTEELQKQVQELSIENNVTFLGKVSFEEKLQYLYACELFVMPSYEIKEEHEIEGFGIVYLEANTAGKFVIAGKNGGVPDAVIDGKTGYLVDGTDAQQIKNAILQYVEKSETEKEYLQKQCTEWADEHRWSKIVKQFEKLF